MRQRRSIPKLVATFALSVVASVAASACFGPSSPDAATAKSSGPGEGADGGAGGTTGEASAGPRERPFAGSAGEATQMITSVVEKKGEELRRCVSEYRVRNKLSRERIDIVFGVDQEGRLIGVRVAKGKSDELLTSCVMSALRDALFPRSHAGIISVTRTFEEIVQ